MMETNKILKGDCAKVLTTLPDECIDLVVTSPPYDKLREYKGFIFDFEAIAKELYRVLKPGGTLVWIVGDSSTKAKGESLTSFKQALFFNSLGMNVHDTMIYEKNAIPYPEVYRYYQCFEYMFILTKGEPKTFNAIQDRKNKHAGMKVSGTERKADGSLKVKPCKKRGAVIKNFGYRWNIWRYNVGVVNYGDKSLAVHPATFPLELAKDHIKTWSNRGDVVLDPMAGSGTTLCMAQELDRKYIGIELAQEYIDLIEYRMDGQRYHDELGIERKLNKLW